MRNLACDVAVVGLGGMGSSTVYQLARRGAKVIGIEQIAPGHDGGSSYGESRAIRLAYFEHESYVPLVRRAYESWRDLERVSGQQVMTITGILEAGHAGSALVKGSLGASEKHGIPHQVLDSREIMRRFPAFRIPSSWYGVFQEDGGIINPGLAIDLFVSGARDAGATLLVGKRVLDITATTAGVEVRLDDQMIEAGVVVISAGAWLASLVPLLQPHLRITRQVLGWFDPLRRDHFSPDACPVFILDAPDDTFYGFPDFAGTGVKVASHMPGETVSHPETLRSKTDAADELRIRRNLDRFAPAASGPLRHMSACMYTRTPDSDFLLDRHPDDSRIILASPCSGHGFKFASVIGEILADMALAGSTQHDLSRFSIKRFSSAVVG